MKMDVKYEHVMQEIGDMIIKKEKKKREPYKLVIINEEELIRQVEIRPMLYDKSLKGYRKSALRDQCWKEIAESVNSTVEECRKRWRSLRDAFAKHYKQLSDVTMSSKKKKWIFYDQMYFIAPYLDCTNSSQESAHITQLQDTSHESILLNEEDPTEYKPHPHHHQIQQHHQNTVVSCSSATVSTTPTTITAVEHVNIDNLHHQHHHHHHHQHQDDGNDTTINDSVTQNDNNTSRTTHTISTIDLNDDNQFVARIFTTEPTDYEHHTITTSTSTCPSITSGVVNTISNNNNHQSHRKQIQQQQQQQQNINVNDNGNGNVVIDTSSINTERCDDDYTTSTNGTTISTTIQQHQQQQSSLSSTTTTTTSITDSDERFLLSCAPILKRLSNKKNALARLRIQQILFSIEFGDQ